MGILRSKCEERQHSNVIFGDDANAIALGVKALEELGLQVDPVTGELKPL